MQTSAAAVLKPVADVIQLIPVDKIDPSPRNARKEFSKEYIAELGASIARDGQQQAGKVRPTKNGRFQLIYGECRWRGAKVAGVEMYKAVVEEMDDARADRLCLIENLKRRDLTVFEEAEHLDMLHKQHKVKIDDLAVQVGISVRSVYEALKLAKLHKTVRDLVTREENPMPVSLAKLIARLPQEQQIQCSEHAEDYDDRWLTHEQLEEYIREEYMVDLRQAPFATNLTGFPCLAPTCDACPKNAKNAKEEFPDLKGAAVCVSPENYRKKVEAYSKAVLADAKKSGKKVLTDEESEKVLSRSGGAYIPLTQEVWVGNERKTLAEVLPKKVELDKALAVDDEGATVEVVKRGELQDALKKAGKTAIANSYEVTGTYSSSGGGGSSHSTDQAKRQKKLKERRAVAVLAINALAEHQHTTAGDDTFVQLLGLGLTTGRVDDNGLKLLLKQLGEKTDGYSYPIVAKLLAAEKGAGLRRLLVRVAMAGGLTAGGTWSDSHDSGLLAGLRLYGLKLEKFQDAAKKQKTAAEKPAPKKDPLDSPAVAKAKAKKAAKTAKKGGGK